jgi:hypothetical protein
VVGYKGFDENLKCHDFQYEVGKEYEHAGPVELCSQGFHFTETPLDVFGYYDPTKRFAKVEASEVSSKTDGDSKRVARRLKVVAELSLSAICGIGAKFILDKADFKGAATNTGNQSAATNTGYQSAATNTGDRSAATNTGYQSAATNTGDRSAATNTGDQSAATNTGDRSAATNTGVEGCAISIGIKGKAKGAKGCWLTLAEWKEGKDDIWNRIDVQTRQVDGKKIKADTFYVLKRGKFVLAEAN